MQLAEEAYDKALLISSLEEIQAWHLKNGTGIVGRLGAGLNPASVEAELKGPGCSPSEELQSLWSWRDGANGDTPFVWYHDFLSLQEALAERSWLRLHPLVQWDAR